MLPPSVVCLSLLSLPSLIIQYAVNEEFRTSAIILPCKVEFGSPYLSV